jgi:hypothetical protein
MYSLFQDNHQPYYIDLDATVAFVESAYEICRTNRLGLGLQLWDPRDIGKYKDAICDHFSYYNVYQEIEDFQDTADKWTIYHSDHYQNMDQTIT